jgi:hypothetical protein
MKINQSHFIAQDNANIYLTAQSAGSLLSDYCYGLLPGLHQGHPPVKLFLSIDNQQQVLLRVQYCRAITRGGYYLHYEEDASLFANSFSTSLLQTSVPLRALTDKGTACLYVVLTVDPFQRTVSGDADPEEIPARLPYTRPAVQLSLLPMEAGTQHAIGAFQLPVGKVKIEDQKVLLDETYIPPCVSVSSHRELLDIYATIEQFYNKVESCGVQIVQKIIQKNQHNELAAVVRHLSEQVMAHVAQQLTELRLLSRQQPPIYLAGKISSLARVFKNTLDYYTGSGKEELINYLMEWCNISQGELEKCITDCCHDTYDHLDLRTSLQQAVQFTRVVGSVFVSLAKLEYIGKRKEAGIFVKEQVIEQGPEAPVKNRRSFLAD